MATDSGLVQRPGPESYSLDCIVMDTETTGFKVADGARIVEIATVDVVAGQHDDGWSCLINPGRKIPVDATRVHGITDAMVADAPKAEDIAGGLRYRLGNAMLCFHNAEFDLPFIRKLLEEGMAPPITNPVVDTLGLARSVYGIKGNGLAEITQRLGLPLESAHRALSDARMTARLLVPLAGWHERHKGIKSFAELAALSQDVMRITNAKFGR